MQHEHDRLTNLSLREDFWKDHEEARKVMQKRSSLEETLLFLDSSTQQLQEAEELSLLAEEADLPFLESLLSGYEEHLRKVELQFLFKPGDEQDAIISINAGAGGTDAQDWAVTLLRMYCRWAEQKGFQVEEQDISGTNEGISSATLCIRGENAYGLLRAEHGVHRVIRISRFNDRRETSFVAVCVVPDLDDTVEVDIREEDLEITYMRSSGAGGQHVNKTESAVRMVHKPTGFTVRADDQRSQPQNKEIAFQRLKGMLFEKARREKEEEFSEAFLSGQGDISFGSQIRTYTLHPTQMVKDERTGKKVTNVSSVLDGNLDDLMESWLLFKSHQKLV